jgi:hypothetical protein
MAANLASFDVAAAITPSDATNFPLGKCRAVYVGGAGNLVAILGGVAVTFTGVPVGAVLNIGPTRINSTSTTATSLVALY